MENDTITLKIIGEKIDNFFQAQDTECVFIVILVIILVALILTIYNYTKPKIKPVSIPLWAGLIFSLLSVISYIYYSENSYINILLLFSGVFFLVISVLFRDKKGKFQNEQKLKQVPLAFKHYESNFNYALKSNEYVKDEYKEVYNDLEYTNGATVNHENFEKYLILRNAIGKNKTNKIIALAYKQMYEYFSQSYLSNLFKLYEYDGVEIPEKIAKSIHIICDTEYKCQYNISNFSFKDFRGISATEENTSNISNTSIRLFIIKQQTYDVKKEDIEKIDNYEYVLKYHRNNRETMCCISLNKAKEIVKNFNHGQIFNTYLDFSINYDSIRDLHNMMVVVNTGKNNLYTGLTLKETPFYAIHLVKEEGEKQIYVSLFNKLKSESLEIFNPNTEDID
ncbi:MAG TPA: hypothetical protein EYG89_00745 [Bacteroidia bacterium]|nr:hypothetical protein [Bacteroidia bacterium]